MVVAVGSQHIFVVHVIRRLRNIPLGKSTVQELAKSSPWSCSLEEDERGGLQGTESVRQKGTF